MFCRNCGVAIENEKAAICVKCGAAVSKPAATTAENVAETTAEATDPAVSKPPMPKNGLVWAILTTICCCSPLGIIGIVNAFKVGSRYKLGDYEGAEKASKNVKKWIIIVLSINALFLVLFLAAVIFFAITSGESVYQGIVAIASEIYEAAMELLDEVLQAM
ncbi:MAG: CD225/dispanin family protein [Fibromonadaceae bacterium]|jgi:uncharacterized membrane protein YvbJ|nr:CD225/dispanin family protein [Fibromonadaceae bacterium]